MERRDAPITTAPRCAAGRAAVAVAVALACALLAPRSLARQSAAIDGRTFAEIDLPAAPQDHPLSLAAARVWTWRDGQTERMLLEREVRVTIGPHAFRARRAVLWLEPVRIGGADAEQLAVYFERVSDPGGAAGLSQQADRLLVTAIIYRTAPTLRADLRTEGRPDHPFLTEAEQRLARYLQSLIEPEEIAAATERRPPGAPPRAAPTDALPGWAVSDDRPPLPPAERTPIVYPREGVVSLYAENIEILRAGADAGAPDETVLLLTGGVSVQHARAGDRARPAQTVQLSAERAVVFIRAGAEGAGRDFGQDDVRGVYLEGDVVATTGRYTLRGRRVYYDTATERAIVLDAVFWTYDEARGMPLYLRAKTIRQESRNQWTARHVRLANVGFAEPHFSIGATEVTLTREVRPSTIPGAPAREVTIADARGISFRFGEMPIAHVPALRGEVRPSILRRIAFDSEQGDAIIRTGWDLYAIAGVDAPEGNSATLLVDGYFNRGPAAGADIEWRSDDISGSLFGYYIYDDGTDLLPSGGEIGHDREHRGMITGEQVWKLSEEWTLFLEGAWISDETFVPAFYRSWAQTRREFINSVYLRRLDDRSGLTIEARGTFNDFVANDYLLQSLGYTTQKLPEIAYHRVGDDLFGGLLSYSGETRLSALRPSFTEPTAAELGFRTVSSARAALGLLPTQSIADELRASGFTEDTVLRADSRHELEMPLRWGPVNIVPFLSGRVTAWDTDFEDFTGKDDNDEYRLWGAAGLRLATSIQRIDDSVRSEALDLHRMRHIIEPSATVWTSGANLKAEDLPVYDDDVESISTGTAARIGVRNTWQTQRGAEGDRRSADWLIIDTNYTWSSDDTERLSPYGRFIEARPEQSNLGEFITNDAVLYLTDALALTSETTYDVENNSLARFTGGVVIDHGFGFSSFAEYRYLDLPRATLVDLGARYELTRKYAAVLTGTIDADRRDFQEIGLRLERRFPQWTLDFRIGFDNITDEFSAGIALRPAGFAGEERLRPFTRDVTGSPLHRTGAAERERLEWGPFRER